MLSLFFDNYMAFEFFEFSIRVPFYGRNLRTSLTVTLI